MADLVRHAIGVDLVDVALRFALGEPVPDEVARPRFQQPLAIRFLTADPGPLPTGPRHADRHPRAGALGRGVVQADTYLQVGETIRPGAARRRPARLRDRDRRHERRGARPRGGGGAAARRGGRRRELRLRPRALPRARSTAAQAGGYRFADFDGAPRARRPDPAPRRRPLARRGACAMAELEARGRRRVDVLPDDASRSSTTSTRARASRAIARLRELGHRVAPHAVYPNVDARRALRSGRRLAQPRSRVHARADRRRGST